MAETIPQGNKWTDAQIAAINEKFLALAKEHKDGLVLMKFIEGPAPYMEGSMAGLDPAEAAKYFRFRIAFPCDTKGEALTGLSIPKSEPRPQKDDSNTVDIPSNWEELHHLQKVRLAKMIGGMPPTEPISLETAIGIIEAELQRRGVKDGD